MTAPSDDIVQKVRQWAAFGDEDMRVAQHTLGMAEDCPYRLVAYHAQQCAEKYLKAYLVLCKTDFPYTHNIARLLELCSGHPDWGQKLKDAEELTPFAITVRYPGEDEPVTDVEAKRALQIALLVRETVGTALDAEGVSL